MFPGLLALVFSAPAASSGLVIYDAPDRPPTSNTRLAACAQREAKGVDETMEALLGQLSQSNNSTSTVAAWHAYQDKLQLKLLQDSNASARRSPYKILIVSTVHDSGTYADIFEANMKTLQSNAAGDQFEAALFHLDGSNEAWRGGYWYTRSVVSRNFSDNCPAMSWLPITPQIASAYDYLWLLDEDMRLDFVSWDFYRTVLSTLDPLVSQPSILPKSAGDRSSDIRSLNMRFPGAGDARFHMAFESARGEVMVLLISAQIWPAVHERLSGNDLRSSFFVDTFWDIIATLGAVECDRVGILVVNAAPARHMDCHSLLLPNAHNHCFKNVAVNNRIVSAREERLVVDALAGRGCSVPENWSQSCPKKADERIDEPKTRGHGLDLSGGHGPLEKCLWQLSKRKRRQWIAPIDI